MGSPFKFIVEGEVDDTDLDDEDVDEVVDEAHDAIESALDNVMQLDAYSVKKSI